MEDDLPLGPKIQIFLRDYSGTGKIQFLIVFAIFYLVIRGWGNKKYTFRRILTPTSFLREFFKTWYESECT